MKNLWSVRLRASAHNAGGRGQNSTPCEIHISGAEGLYAVTEIRDAVRRYVERALSHTRGKADKVIITVEEIKQRPRVISSLPVATIACRRKPEAEDTARKILESSGVSKKSIGAALKIIEKGNMRGAAVITAEGGKRLEPDRKRGIRVSRLGIGGQASKILSSTLSRYKINTETVNEALVLASKVSSCRQVVAELCVSDDPDYTTGYVASGRFGYIRIPHLKSRGSLSGGRAFFVLEDTNIEEITHYMEKVPVIIAKVGRCSGILQLNEILNRSHN